MLQHNAIEPEARSPNRAHLAHALMVGMHALCCGLPIAALMLTAASGAAFGTAAFFSLTSSVHHILHAHEIWILAASICLVIAGGAMEWRARRPHKSEGGQPHGFPWMFALSVFCLAANIAILVLHRAV